MHHNQDYKEAMAAPYLQDTIITEEDVIVK